MKTLQPTKITTKRKRRKYKETGYAKTVDQAKQFLRNGGYKPVKGLEMVFEKKTTLSIQRAEIRGHRIFRSCKVRSKKANYSWLPIGSLPFYLLWEDGKMGAHPI